MSRPSLVILRTVRALALAGMLSACSDGSGCPSPVFAPPATASWTHDTTPAATGDRVVVRWAQTAGDPLPDTYYEPMVFSAAPDAGRTPVTTITRTASRELTLEMPNLGSYLRTVSSTVVVRMRFNDTRAYVSCSHPGMSDIYVVDLTLVFDTNTQTATARFGEVLLLAGGCSVAAPGSHGAGRVGASLVAGALLLLGRRRRREGVRRAA